LRKRKVNRIKVCHQSRRIKEALGILLPLLKAGSPSPHSRFSPRCQPQALTIMQKSLYCILERFQMYHVQGLCFQKFQLNLSRTALSRAGGVHLISPALGLESVPGHPLYVTQTLLTIQILSYRWFSPFCFRPEILCKPQSASSVFRASPPSLVFSYFAVPNLRASFSFSPANLKPRLASLFAIFPIAIFLLLSLDWFFVTRSSFQSAVTDKGKLFERIGRKITDLLNGGWVAEVTPSAASAHSFETKNGLFLYSQPSLLNQERTMNIPCSLLIKHTELDPSYIPLAYRREVLARDKGLCHFCHQPTSYFCHDLVKCRGGKTLPDNLLTCCTLCRRQKGELTAAEYREHRQAISLRLEDIFKEMTMRIQVFFADARRPPVTGEVDAPVTPTTRAFYIRRDGNGKRSLIFTEPGMLIDDLDVHNIGGKS